MKAHLAYKGQPSCFHGNRQRPANTELNGGYYGGYHELVSKDVFERLLQNEPDYVCKRCIKSLFLGKFDRPQE